MTLSDILASVFGRGGGAAAPAPAAQPPANPPTPQEAIAYRKYTIACQEQGMQPRSYPAWVAAGRPAE